MALAAPGVAGDEEYKRATQLDDDGDYQAALAAIDEGLAAAPQALPLLGLKGTVLLKMRDYAGALAAYQAYLAAGARGANRRDAEKIVTSLRAVQSTFLDITLANGPANVYLDTKAQGVFCAAAASCNKPVLPGVYRVVAERDGFAIWTRRNVTVDAGKTTKVEVVLVEKSSPLTIRGAPLGARVTVDGTVPAEPATLAPGDHQVVVSRAGYVEARLPTTAHEGKPIDLDVALTQLVAIRTEPPGATLLFDGKPVAPVGGKLAIPPGAHVLVARAPGFSDRRIEIPAERGPDYQLAVQLARPVEPAAVARPETSTRKLAGVALMEAGVAGLLVGFLFVAQEHEGVAPSSGQSFTDTLSQSTTARTVLAVGGAAIVTGAILRLTAPSEPDRRTARIAPLVGDHDVGLVVAGRF